MITNKDIIVIFQERQKKAIVVVQTETGFHQILLEHIFTGIRESQLVYRMDKQTTLLLQPLVHEDAVHTYRKRLVVIPLETGSFNHVN